jgi:hypothetical protein
MKKLVFTSFLFIILLLESQAQTCFTPIWTGNGLDHMNFYITLATVNGVDMQPGDEIAVFDGNDCVGVSVLTEVLTGSNYLQIKCSLDDPDTPAKDGFTIGNTPSFRLCINSGTDIVTDVGVVYSSGSGVFSASGTAVAQLSGVTECSDPPSITLSSSGGSTCSSDPITVSGNTFGGSATSVSITENGAGSVSPLTTSANPFSFTYTPASGDIGNTVVITITTDNPLGDPCTEAVATYSLTVTPDNTINLSSATGTDDQELCINTAIADITYTTTGATGANITGLPASVTGAWSADQVTISGTPTESGTFNYNIELTGGCGNISANGSIVVNPDNTINLSSAAGTDDQELCINTAIADITYTTTGATGANITGLPAGVTGAWSADQVTISGTPTESGTFNYTVNLTGGCGDVTTAGTVTVNPLPTISILTAPECAPDLQSYSLSVTVSAGTVTSTAGTVTDEGSNEWAISAIPAGTDITLTVTDGNSCESTLEVTAPDCSCPPIAAPTSGGDQEYCEGDAIPEISASVQSGETVDWYAAATGGSPLLQNSLTYTPAAPGTWYAEARNTTSGCTSSTRTAITVTENPLPGDAGSISGPSTFIPGSTGVEYSVSPIANTTAYAWSYSGTGVTINGSGPVVALDFALSATTGDLSVKGLNSCGEGAESTLQIEPGTKTLNLTSIMLQGLYSGSGEMNQVWDESGPHWEEGVADHITIELHSSANYSTVVHTATDVELNTDGTASLTIPAEYNGSYYITIKHRNSVETTSAAPVSFAPGIINKSFGSRSEVYGGNLGESGDGYYVIYAGDVNQDGFIDTQDFIGVDNDSYNYRSGYLVTDVDGNGFIDTNDYIFIDNNNYNYIGTIHP